MVQKPPNSTRRGFLGESGMRRLSAVDLLIDPAPALFFWQRAITHVHHAHRLAGLADEKTIAEMCAHSTANRTSIAA
jgi:hypothetical protein